MPIFDWLEEDEKLSPAALTVRAQTLPPDDNGQLLYPLFFPSMDVDSMNLKEVLEMDFRPAADRREWDAPERRLVLKMPDTRDIEMIPLGMDHVIGEKEMDKLDQNTNGNEAVFQEVIGAKIPARADMLVMGCYRQLELDCFEVWTKGGLTQRDPQSKRTYFVDYQIEAGRLQTAATPWATATNAYEEFIAWLKDGDRAIGGAEGVLAKSDVYDTILADAPVGINGGRLTGQDLIGRIKDDAMISDFGWFKHNGTVDQYVDGGTETRRRDVFPDREIVLIPKGGAVGRTAKAPVRRARKIANAVPEANIDVRGATIFYFGMNDDKGLKIVSQLNAFPTVNDSKIWGINIGAR